MIIINLDDFKEEFKSQIKKVVEYANNNIIKFENLFDGPAGDNENYVCHILGHRCVYSIEENKGNILCKHLSISLEPFRGKLPLIQMATIIMNEFGIEGNLKEVDKVWIEDINGIPTAVNILKIHEQPTNQQSDKTF